MNDAMCATIVLPVVKSEGAAAVVSPGHVPQMSTPQGCGCKRTKALAVIDTEARSQTVVDSLIDLSGRGLRLNVLLLNVQPNPVDWQLRCAPEKADNRRLGCGIARRALTHAKRQLDCAGIDTEQRIEFGAPVEVIARCANESNFEILVFAADRKSKMRQWLARAVKHLIGSVPCAVGHHARASAIILVGSSVAGPSP